jgi:hypothetical protein
MRFHLLSKLSKAEGLKIRMRIFRPSAFSMRGRLTLRLRCDVFPRIDTRVFSARVPIGSVYLHLYHKDFIFIILKISIDLSCTVITFVAPLGREVCQTSEVRFGDMSREHEINFPERFAKTSKIPNDVFYSRLLYSKMRFSAIPANSDVILL